MSCNYCYHRAEDHDGPDCGTGICRTCTAKREEARRDRLALLQEPRGQRNLSALEQADMYANESLMILINDRRMLIEEVRRLSRELSLRGMRHEPR